MFLFFLTNLATGGGPVTGFVYYVWLMGDENCESIG